MTQDELWFSKYKEVMDFIETNHVNPSKHRVEEHQMLNFIKHNRKLMNAGKMKEDRVEKFEMLLEMGERYKRVNQYI
jgi:hypothetical protein